MYNFVPVMVCFRFCKIVFVCKLLFLYGITELHVLFEIITSLLNGPL